MIHTVFLAILLGLMQFASHIEPLLPNWMTDTLSDSGRGKEISIITISCFLAMIVMHLIERRWLYVEVEAAFSDVEDKE